MTTIMRGKFSDLNITMQEFFLLGYHLFDAIVFVGSR